MSTEQHLPDDTRTAAASAGSPSPTDPPQKRGLDLSVSKVGGGALAAMTAAVVGSHLSLAGTVIGAAVASVVAAIAGSVYTTSLARTHDRVRGVLGRRVGEVRPRVPQADSASASTADGPAPRRRISLKNVLVGALLVFGIAAVALTGIELATGSALSGGQGTTIGQVSEGKAAGPTTPTKAPSSGATAKASPTTSATATEVEPSSAPTASRTTTEPTSTGSAQPSASSASSTAPTQEPSTTAPSSTSEPTVGAPGGTASGSEAPGAEVTPQG